MQDYNYADFAPEDLNLRIMNPRQPAVSIAMLLWGWLSALVCFGLDADKLQTSLQEQTLSQLEERLEEIDEDLKNLANYGLRSGIGSIGYRSLAHSTPENTEWIEINFGKDYPIDEVVLVPTIWRDTEQGFQADAFPEKFKIIAGSESDPTGRIIAEVNSADNILPRIAPLILSTPGTVASWIRIEVSHLSLRAFDRQYVLELAEVLVFSGEENVALHKPVSTFSNVVELSNAWDSRYLVDGFMPYLMDAAQGEQKIAFVSQPGTYPSIIIDLEKAYPISRIHMHAVDQSDTVPQAYAGDLGIPKSLLVEGATRADFSDAVVLLRYQRGGINDTGPIIMQAFPETTVRFVRFIPLEQDPASDPSPGMARIGFAEIELFSNGRNVALGKSTALDPAPPPSDSNRPIEALTDGNNHFGAILSVRQWMNELAYRHELETERPLVMQELNRRYARQKANLTLMTRLVLLLGIGIAFTILIDRNIRLKQAARIKERFAADLHDELGADLHALGLLTDLAKESVDSRDELLELLDRTRVFTERSGMAARYCTNMLEAKGLCEDLVDEMERTSRRLLTDLQYELIFEGKEILKNLKPRRRIDLFFFYRESLTNILRHSGATKVRIRITADEKVIRLAITDNGHGIKASDTANGLVPPSLKRRARLLRAKVSLEHPDDGGTKVVLVLKIRKFPFL